MPEHSNRPTPTRAMRRQGQRMTKQERQAAQEKFLKSFSMTANVRAACMAAGIDRSMVCEEEPVFDAKGMPLLDAKGKQIVKRGKPIMEPEYSDSLLALLAKAR